jgi:TonB family protein
MKNRSVVVALLTFAIAPVVVAAQAPNGQKIHARPGDMVLVEGSDRVRIVRRRDAQVRTVYNSRQRWLVLLVDYAPTGAEPDGRVDATFRCEQIVGTWPLGERWEGRTPVDEYSLAGEPAFHGVGISGPGGLLQVLSPAEGTSFRDPSASAAVTFRRVGRGGSGLPFDVAEHQQMMALGAVSSAAAATAAPHPGQQPIRVGGNIRPPAKLQDVRPVYPEAALASRVTGLVILEAIIGTDGNVTDAKVVKSVPLLDDAAMTAVRQWKFEPTLLNGVPVPVIMTVTVSFNLQ